MLYTRFGQTHVDYPWQCAYCDVIMTPEDTVYFQYTDPIDYDDQPIAEEEFSLMCLRCRRKIEDNVKHFTLPVHEPFQFLWGTTRVIKDDKGRRSVESDQSERSSALADSQHHAEDSLP